MFETFRLAFFICILILLSVSDIRRGIIPNKIVYPAILVTIVLTLISPEASITMSLICGATLAGILIIPAVLFRRMGLGDVKLAFLIGLMTGFPEGVIALFSGIVMGGLFAIFLLVFKLKGLRDVMPYGPFLAAGTITILLAERLSLLPIIYPLEAGGLWNCFI